MRLTALVGAVVPAALAAGFVLTPAASAATAPPPAMVKCWSPIVDGQYTGPFIGQTGSGPSMITMCRVAADLTNHGPVLQVYSPFDGGHSPMYHLNAIPTPAYSSMVPKPLPVRNLRSMQCSLVERHLVPGFVARWPHVRCQVQFRQRLPLYKGAVLRLIYGKLSNYFSIKGVVSARAVTTKLPIKMFP